jgi:hypothetical protein
MCKRNTRPQCEVPRGCETLGRKLEKSDSEMYIQYVSVFNITLLPVVMGKTYTHKGINYTRITTVTFVTH